MSRLHKITLAIMAVLLLFPFKGAAQEIIDTSSQQDGKPVILYSEDPKSYIIQDISVEGAEGYEDNIIVGLSGLTIGQKVIIPGADITDAAKRYWRHGLFADVSIEAEKIVGDRIWLKVHLTMRPRVTDIVFHGIKKSEKEEVEKRVGMIKGNQVTPNAISRAQTLIKRYFDDKGFNNAEITISQRDNPDRENEVYVDVNVDKKEKIKVHEIHIEGNEVLADKTLKKAMKKTNEKNKLLNIFKSKKFVNDLYETDKENIIAKYNEHGYRDAMIVEDSVVNFDDASVDIFMRVEEGEKYYLRNVTWVGNTLYTSDMLDFMLRMKKGDVYNQKLLDERISSDEDAIGNLYYNNGYIFYSLEPVEVNIVGDSIDLEMRIYEGQQATINKITINGNDQVYENVVRRELYIKPGALFSRDDLIRTMRELQQLGNFDPEQMTPDIDPQIEDGTVNIDLNLVPKPNDQVELSAGWGQTGIIGKLSFTFNNFSFRNLFHPDRSHRGLLPRGDGQSLSISGQSNGSYYQSYSMSFTDPWFGGKRPNTFQVSAYYYNQSDISSRYYNSAYYSNFMNSYYSGMYGYGNYNYGNYSNISNYYDPDQYMRMYGLSILFGKRLKWPDDYFQASAELSFDRYVMSEWRYFPVTDGTSNDFSLNLTLARASTDNPLYPRSGSEFTFSLNITPPYSLFDGIDYSKYNQENQDDYNKMHRWIEYHKWKFKSKIYIPLLDPYTFTKTPVLMAKAEFGLLGHYNKYKKSPFNTFDVGGDGMTGYTTYATESIALRGYENSSLTPYRSQEGYAYAKIGLELRYPLLLETSTTLYILGFVEAGNAWHDVNKFNPFDLKRSAGLGARIYLPMVGLMGIDWGYGFDKVFGSKSAGGSHFHFVLGQEF